MNGENDNLKELKESVPSNETYRETGYRSKDTKSLTTLDLIYSAIIGVLGGIISSLVPFSLLMKWYPLVGGTQLVSGHHVIWGVIVYGLTKNKKNIVLTMVSKGILEFILGDPWGILILIVNVMEGLLLSLGFYIMEKLREDESRLGWGIAGALGNFFQAPFFWVINQRWHLHWSLWALAFIFALISGILITGILGRTIKNGLIKAGVPTTF